MDRLFFHDLIADCRRVDRDTSRPVMQLVVALLMFASLASSPLWAGSSTNPLLEEIGRNESRILSEAFPIQVGGTVTGYQLPERLERLGYERVRGQRPDRPGQYFFGTENFWIYRRAFRWSGTRYDEGLIGLRLEPSSGRVLAAVDGDEQPLSMDDLRLDPEVLAEALDERRAVRVPFRLSAVPDHVWRPLLAAEDARFFDHVGVDGRALARALLANAKKGGVAQGGSTLTQQLIKNRDLTPRRSLGRKASEALRALALEAQVDKEHILEAYLDQVYLGHRDGLAIHGYGTAARVYFSKSAPELDLAEAATLAAMIQGPNRLDPAARPQAVKTRRDWVLGRLETLGWADAEALERARAQPVRVRPSAPEAPLGPSARAWVAAEVASRLEAPVEKGRGVIVESRIDPLLQAHAEATVVRHLDRLRRELPARGGAPVEVALVALEARTGAVLAAVGGDPRTPGGFDRVRQARRQPGSTVKPLLLLEAFDDCGSRDPLHPASRVADEPLEIDLPSGPWRPENADTEFRGTITTRLALAESRNVPMVRIGRHCGFDAVAATFRRAGLPVPSPPPPSMALGAIEVSPLELAAAYTTFANEGDASTPWLWSRLEKPSGGLYLKRRSSETRVARATSSFLVHDLMLDAVRDGTAMGAALDLEGGLEAAAKTGTSSDRRDAWLAGDANGIVTVVWVGRDDASSLGRGGGTAAAPLWHDFMELAAPARPPRPVERPDGVVTKYIDSRSGLLVRSFNSKSVPEIFRRDALPRRDRFWRDDESIPVVR